MSRYSPIRRLWMLLHLAGALAGALACPPAQAQAAGAEDRQAEARSALKGRVKSGAAAGPKSGARSAAKLADKSEARMGAKSGGRPGARSGARSDEETADLAEGPIAAPPRPRPKPPGGARPSRTQIHSMIAEVSRQYGVERELVAAVVAAESNYNAHAVSPVGAVGLMQVMPSTAADYGVGSTHALFDPKTNLKTGTRHLKRLLSKYRNDYGRVIMAYNAGEGVVDRTNSNVTYTETLNYTEAVINHYRRNGGAQPTHGALTKVRSLRGMRSPGKARRLMKRYLDPSLLSLKVKPTLSRRLLNPALHEVGPESRPMFELELDDLR